ncbi:phospholipase D-like domain-containing protein [bacterium]|nr:phospholipase D-like domain-containing protein [bacterium]
MNVEVLRIIVASPSDVQPERNLVDEVIKELNQGIAADRRLRLEVVRWEIDTHPGFHPDGPQGLIDSLLNIGDSDILIGIFWKRFGTPTNDAASGTEHEFKTAFRAWKETGRPQIMIYFNQKKHTPKSKDEADQWGQVLQFKEQLPQEGLWWDYDGKRQFERLLRRHLRHFIRQQYPLSCQASERRGSGVRAGSVTKTKILPTKPFRTTFMQCIGRHPKSLCIVSPFIGNIPGIGGIMDFARLVLREDDTTLQIVTRPPSTSNDTTTLTKIQAEALSTLGVDLLIRMSPLLHSKVYQFNFREGDRASFVGSANFSRGGLELNDESVAFFQSEGENDRVKAELDRLRGKGTKPYHLWKLLKQAGKDGES